MVPLFRQPTFRLTLRRMVFGLFPARPTQARLSTIIIGLPARGTRAGSLFSLRPIAGVWEQARMLEARWAEVIRPSDAVADAPGDRRRTARGR